MKRVSSSYLDLRDKVAVESFNFESTLASYAPNFQVLFPWMTKPELSMTWFPSCQISLDNKN